MLPFYFIRKKVVALLNVRQRSFCEYYVECGNATEAAKKAGYSEKTAYSIGNENLKKPEVKNYIKELMDKKLSDNILNANEVLSLLSDIAKGKTKEEVVLTVGVGNGLSDTQIVEKRVSEKERLKALELLGKRHMLFTDKTTVDLNIPVLFEGDEDLES